MSVRQALRRPRTWFIIVPIVVVLVAVVAPYVYIHFIKEDAPPPLGFSDLTTASDSGATNTTGGTGTTASTTAGSSTGVDGQWAIAGGSVAGYRVHEVLFGQDSDAAGRTSDVTGQMTIAGTKVTSADFTVDLTSVTSDESRRDNQFRGRIMDVNSFPTAKFELSEPADFGSLPADQKEITVPVTGELTVHGVTKSVTAQLTARRNGAAIEVTGSIPVKFSDYEISDPSFGPATVQDHGSIEFALVFNRA